MQTKIMFLSLDKHYTALLLYHVVEHYYKESQVLNSLLHVQKRAF